MTASVNDALLQKTGGEVTATLAHMKHLLRIRNQLCSPLLRLPTETIIRILAFIMADLDSVLSHIRVAMPIYGSCHHIHNIMRHATELWWRVDFACIREAHSIFLRSRRDPRVLLLDTRRVFSERCSGVEGVLDHWRNKLGFKGRRLHTLEFCGSSSTFSHFSWILERPLPRVEHLKIHIGKLIGEELVEEPQDPLPVELPAMPLRVLDLRNVTLSWSSQLHLFNGLRELHLNLRDCDHIVEIPEEELFGIFDASPRLEHLSLLKIGHRILVVDDMPLPPKRILQFPNLTSLSLENSPMVLKYTLEYMDLPVIASLKIRSFVSWRVVPTAINLFFPAADGHFPTRLLPGSTKFAVSSIDDEPDPSIKAEIGGVTLQLDFPFDESELGRSLFMSCIPQLVPPSATTLKFDYTNLAEQGWRDFFTSHPEVRSIECTEGCGVPVSKSLWNALSPTGDEGAGVACPKLESIYITTYTDEISFTSLSDCLRNRQIAGFTLKRLNMLDFHGFMGEVDLDEFHQEFDLLVETVEAGGRFGSKPGMSPVPICELGCVLTGIQWGRKYRAHLWFSKGLDEEETESDTDGEGSK